MSALRITANQLKQDESEAAVEKIVGQMGHVWRGDKKGAPGLDGRIEIAGSGGELTGLIIEVQVKSGRSYLSSRRKQEDASPHMPMRCREIRIDRKYMDYFRLITHAPVILIWYDHISENCFWGQIDDSSTNTVRVPHVFDRYAARRIAGLARAWHRRFQEIAVPGIPRLSLSAPKRDAFLFYKRWRTEGCLSPTFGKVEITLRGWRHLTQAENSQLTILSKIRLLGAARSILETLTTRQVCRVIHSTPCTRVLYKQTARLIFQDRADAIVSVITDSIGGGAPRFLSVFESRKGVEGR